MDFPGLRTAQIARMQELMRTGHGNNNFNLAVYLEIGAISYETLISIVGVTERHMEETVGLSEAEYQSALVFIEEALFEIEQISY